MAGVWVPAPTPAPSVATAGRLPRRLREPQLLPVGARPLLLHTSQLELVLELPRPDFYLDSFTLGIAQVTLDLATTMPRGLVAYAMRGRTLDVALLGSALIRVMIPAHEREAEDALVLGLADPALEDEQALERVLLGI